MHICVRKGDITIQSKGGGELFDELRVKKKKIITFSEVNDSYSLINT